MSKFILFTFGIVSILFGILIKGNILNFSYSDVFLLPIGYGLYLLFLSSIYQYLSGYFVFWIISFQQVIRYLIIPFLFLSQGDLIYGDYTSNGEYAIYMMLVELIIQMIIFVLIASKNKTFKNINQKGLDFLKINPLNIAILIFFIGILLINTTFFTKVSFIWDFSKYIKLKREGNVEDISPIVSILFPLIRAYIILFLFSLINKTKFRISTKLIFSIIIIVLNATIIVGTSRFSIVYATFPLVLLIIYLYPQFKRRIGSFSLIFFFIAIIISSISKYSRDEQTVDAFDFFSIHQLNAYFGGVVNYSMGYDAYNSFNDPNRLKYFSSDILQNIPVLSKLADDNYKTNIIFNENIYGFNSSLDQIVPISIAGLFHFSLVFFFIYIGLFTYLSFVFERVAYSQSSPISFVLFIILGFACSTNMMINIGSLSSTLFINFLVLVPLFRFLNKINLQNENNF